MAITFVKSPYFQSRQGQKIVGIVLHTMQGSYKGTIAYFQKNDSQVSAHYCVDLNGDITQMVDEKDAANHAGIVSVPTFKQTVDRPGVNPNWYTLGLEHADNGDPTGADRKNQYPATIRLVADLCRKYAIPCDRGHICGHREIRSTKSCPGNFDVDYVVKEAWKILNPTVLTDVPLVLQKYGKGSLSDLVGYIDSLRQLQADLEPSKALADNRGAFISSIAQQLNCSNDQSVISTEITGLLKDSAIVEDAQKAVKDITEAKNAEIIGFQAQVTTLQAKIAQMEVDHTKEIQMLKDQVTALSAQVNASTNTTKQVSFLEQVLNGWNKLIKKGK